jgi:hypothetical protein
MEVKVQATPLWTGNELRYEASENITTSILYDIYYGEDPVWKPMELQ